MGRLNREASEIHAKIVYCGAEGSGTTANLRFIHRKLKRAHRGELRTAYAGKNKHGPHEFLPVQLGPVRGYQTSIHLHTCPGGDRFAKERRRILDGVDGIVFVADLRPERHEGTVAALEDVREHLESYGRGFDDVLLVIQYNRRDQADESTLEKLHARLGVKPQAHFEAIASEGTGVLQCLTTLSKAILARLRREADQEDAPAEASLVSAEIEPASASGEGFTLESSGPVESHSDGLAIPLRIVCSETGRAIELCLRVSLAG